MGKTEIAILSILILMPLAALYDLRRREIDKFQIWIWAGIILFLPFFGPVAYLLYSNLKYKYKNS